MTDKRLAQILTCIQLTLAGCKLASEEFCDEAMTFGRDMVPPVTIPEILVVVDVLRQLMDVR
jgi:hypothetical protein